MSQYFSCKIHFLIALLNTIHSQIIPTFVCHFTYLSNCKLSNVNLTGDTKNFLVIPDESITDIHSFTFKSSQLEVLTDDVCKAFPFIQDFEAFGLKLMSVESNAFKKCINLKTVDLSFNSLQTLPDDLFAFNVELIMVFLNSNELSDIKTNIFKNNQKLKELYLQNNKLTTFSFGKEGSILENFTTIDLNNNLLGYFDIVSILQKCPNIQEIQIKNNNFGLLANEYETIIETALQGRKNKPRITIPKTQIKETTTQSAHQTEKTIQSTSENEQILFLDDEVSRLVHEQKRSNLIILVVGLAFGLLVIGLIVVWIRKKFYSGSDIDDEAYEYYDPPERYSLPEILSKKNVSVSKDDPYYEYVEGFHDQKVEDVQSSEMNNYDDLNFN